MIELTEKQRAGVNLAVERYVSGEKYTVIAGYAGTGKSTTVRFIIEALGIDEKDVCYATFTGKAAQVLSNKGNKNVSTLHKLLYDTKLLPDGVTYVRTPVDYIPYKLVCVDEVSMAPMTLMKLLFRQHCHVICLGDPFQLPSIDKNEDNHLLDNPHVFLDEIMRQEGESEIVQLATKIRNFQPYSLNDFNKDVQIIQKQDISEEIMKWADQILVGTNALRKQVNDVMRSWLGYSANDTPQEGDKVICMHNYWDIFSSKATPLVNGTIGYLKSPLTVDKRPPARFNAGILKTTIANIIIDDEEHFTHLPLDTKMIMTGEKGIDPKKAYQLNKSPKTAFYVPLEFAYGYAITTHRAQGSEWDKVLVFEERFPFDRVEHARWLYTAVTRGSDRLILVKP